jgi:arsenate reductase
MEKIKVYEKPTCTTCKKVISILKEKGIDFEEINYYIEPLTKDKLESLLAKMGMKPSELLRKNEKAYKETDIDSYDESEILELMLLESDLIQRLIIISHSQACFCKHQGSLTVPHLISDNQSVICSMY